MEKVNELIARLTAISNFCKDIHYNNVTYQDHLLADRVNDDFDTDLDDIKEQLIIANKELPLASKEYLKRAIEFIPNVNAEENKVNWLALEGLLIETRDLLTEMKMKDRGSNALLDNIAQKINTDLALLFIQTRRADKIEEAVEQDHEAATETPVDRKEYSDKVPEISNVQKKTLEYDKQNVLVAEENTLDKVARKLGI